MKTWKCPKCKREFKYKNQAHSCKQFPIENHFKNRPESKKLYGIFKKSLKKAVGKFKVDSPACCIHFVKDGVTFSGCYIMKNKIRVFFMLQRKIKNKRIYKSGMISSKRFNYLIDISKKQEIDKELMNWIKEARNLIS